eukprot:1469029-Pyramimonas_sp.AAC.1
MTRRSTRCAAFCNPGTRNVAAGTAQSPIGPSRGKLQGLATPAGTRMRRAVRRCLARRQTPAHARGLAERKHEAEAKEDDEEGDRGT